MPTRPLEANTYLNNPFNINFKNKEVFALVDYETAIVLFTFQWRISHRLPNRLAMTVIWTFRAGVQWVFFFNFFSEIVPHLIHIFRWWRRASMGYGSENDPNFHHVPDIHAWKSTAKWWW